MYNEYFSQSIVFFTYDLIHLCIIVRARVCVSAPARGSRCGMCMFSGMGEMISNFPLILTCYPSKSITATFLCADKRHIHFETNFFSIFNTVSSMLYFSLSFTVKFFSSVFQFLSFLRFPPLNSVLLTSYTFYSFSLPPTTFFPFFTSHNYFQIFVNSRVAHDLSQRITWPAESPATSKLLLSIQQFNIDNRFSNQLALWVPSWHLD